MQMKATATIDDEHQESTAGSVSTRKLLITGSAVAAASLHPLGGSAQ
jgi:hypothetical protein